MALTCAGRPINLNHMSKAFMCLLANTVWTLAFEFCPLSVAIRGRTLQGITVRSSWIKNHDTFHWKMPKREYLCSLLSMPAYCPIALKVALIFSLTGCDTCLMGLCHNNISTFRLRLRKWAVSANDWRKPVKCKIQEPFQLYQTWRVFHYWKKSNSAEDFPREKVFLLFSRPASAKVRSVWLN